MKNITWLHIDGIAPLLIVGYPIILDNVFVVGFTNLLKDLSTNLLGVFSVCRELWSVVLERRRHPQHVLLGGQSTCKVKFMLNKLLNSQQNNETEHNKVNFGTMI